MPASLPRLYCHNTMTAPIGLSVKRREDRRLLTGRGHYVDDVRLPHLCHAAIVRSPHAHARILDVDARRATALPGVVAVLTIADLPECAAAVPPLVTSPRFRPYVQPAIAGAKVRHVGEAVAVVVADDVYRAADAAEVLDVRYAVLPAVATVEAALAKGAARVFDEWPDNVAGPAAGTVGDVTRGFAQAHVVVEARLRVPRVAAMPIEPRGVVAQPDAPDVRLTVWASTQMPFAVRAAVAAALDLAEEQVRVIAPDVGGGFGAKGHVYPEDVLIPAVARRLGRAVKWIETRREHFLATAPDRDQHHHLRLGVASDGAIAAIETTFTRDGGAYPVLVDVITLNTINHLPGPYRVAHLKASAVNGRQRLGSAAKRSAAGGIPVVLEEVDKQRFFVLGRNRRAVLDHAVERVGPAPGAEALLHRDLHAVTDHTAHDQLPARRLGDRRVLSGREREAKAQRHPGGHRQEGRSPQATPHQP